MRIILKVSGESLKGDNNLDKDALEKIYKEILNIKGDNELLIVVGGGNFWRGRNNLNINSNVSDYIGMMGTIMNCLALTSYLNNQNLKTTCYSAFAVEKVIQKEHKRPINQDLKSGKIVVLGGGCGVPGYSTDMTTITKAIEYDVETILMAKNIDGVYDKDPHLKNAKKIDKMTHKELLDLSLRQGKGALTILDIEALKLLKKHKIPLYIYKSGSAKNIDKVLNNEIGTCIISK